MSARRLLALTGLAVAACGGSAADAEAPYTELHPNDVAVLFPLPATTAAEALLHADAVGAHGVLLPSWATDPLFFGQGNDPAVVIPSLRLVALNLDNCFPAGIVGSPDCRYQVRVIFQPLVDSAGTLTTQDIAVHVFYDLAPADFTSLVQAISRQDDDFDAATDGPVGVHPAMQGARGAAYQQQYQDLILTAIGADRLTKVTVMALQGAGVGWSLAGVDFQGMVPTDLAIPATPEMNTRQELRQTLTGSSDFQISMDPTTRFTDEMKSLFNSTLARGAARADIEAAVRKTLVMDDPRSTENPGSVDCASCHVATPLREWAERELQIDSTSWAERYVNPRHDLTNTGETKSNSSSMRCFGYFGRATAISQRTIDEAAAVTDYINDVLLGTGGAQ